jgi:hypothetical protein
METMGVSVRRCLQNFKGRRSAKSLVFWEKTGAGEGIRTLDPNLGKYAKSFAPLNCAQAIVSAGAYGKN